MPMVGLFYRHFAMESVPDPLRFDESKGVGWVTRKIALLTIETGLYIGVWDPCHGELQASWRNSHLKTIQWELGQNDVWVLIIQYNFIFQSIQESQLRVCVWPSGTLVCDTSVTKLRRFIFGYLLYPCSKGLWYSFQYFTFQSGQQWHILSTVSIWYLS